MTATTLLDELAQAAEDADLLAETLGSEHYRRRAAGYRARMEHVRGAVARARSEIKLHAQAGNERGEWAWTLAEDQMERLCGPLPEGTAGTKGTDR